MSVEDPLILVAVTLSSHPDVKNRRYVIIGIKHFCHILLSDENPCKNVTKTPSGAELTRVFWSHFPSGFGQTAIYDQE